jgi:hypothetical protein
LLRTLLGSEVYNPAAEAQRYEGLVKVAARLRDPSYSLKDYLDDVLPLLPEMRLYMAVKHPSSGASAAATGTSSGRSMRTEYVCAGLRTRSQRERQRAVHTSCAHELRRTATP